jgi:multisubunit Na+/H+ antiporter MnhE subunit
MIRLLPFPLAAAGLFALWLLLSQAFSLGHVLVGGAISLIGGGALTTLQPPKVRIRRHRADPGCIPANSKPPAVPRGSGSAYGAPIIR